MRRILTCGVALSLMALVAVWVVTRNGDPNRIPDDWNLAEIAKGMIFDPGPIHVLAWIRKAMTNRRRGLSYAIRPLPCRP